MGGEAVVKSRPASIDEISCSDFLRVATGGASKASNPLFVLISAAVVALKLDEKKSPDGGAAADLDGGRESDGAGAGDRFCAATVFARMRASGAAFCANVLVERLEIGVMQLDLHK